MLNKTCLRDKLPNIKQNVWCFLFNPEIIYTFATSNCKPNIMLCTQLYYSRKLKSSC